MNIPESLIAHADTLEAYYQEHFPELAPLVRRCFLNTIETTVTEDEDGYFVITGDIPAMWLRDSASQVGLYTRFAGDDPGLQKILEGVIARQAEFILRDPYANAFTASTSDPSAGYEDDTLMVPGVWERKYEVDSLTAPVILSYKYWKAAGKTGFFDERWKQAAYAIIKVYRTEQDHSSSDYRFSRTNCPETDTLPNGGAGNPVVHTGMTWSGFRPSDDRCIYGYLIPSNMAAVVALRELGEIAGEVYKDAALKTEALALAGQIEEGIERYGIVQHPVYGRIYAYETDGAGNTVLMDDANVPSLLAIPYIGYRTGDDEVTRNTRRFVLSSDNPYYNSGQYARGIGSPHTPEGYVWHIALIMQAMTSTDRGEIMSILHMLAETHANTCFMHESFDPDRPGEYTRSWFAWANTLFAELMQNLMEEGFFDKD